MNTAASAQGKNILLVDDDPDARESIKLMLSIDRHQVTEAASGHEALQLFTGARYDFVITDYFMPGMLGDELVQNIRNISPTQPILMVTAYLEKLAAGGNPAAALLGKPLSVDDLRRAMASSAECGTSQATASNTLPSGFSRADLSHRVSANTDVLSDILRRKGSVRGLHHWGIND